MIGKLTGRVDSVSTNHLIIDVQGVGYVVMASANTLRSAGGAGSSTSLLIETQVREDAINLFGFADELERDWFRLLTTVQGVGSKVALNILSSIQPSQLAQAIASQDKATVTKAEGVGPKLALRIVTELKDKVINFLTPGTGVAISGEALPSKDMAEAISALVNLGYKRVEAFAAATTATSKLGENAKLETIIRASLKELQIPQFPHNS
ncbi:MAG: Holliday junction branch migration protein RuvA [Alphaproteobacteria bacterium]|nr:Holliday junction branch migration protein RuvA [Alphaproteobacteria bacterium]